MKKILILLLVLVCLPLASAKTYHMALLTVSEETANYTGGIADVYLEVKPGSGRIFIDSFPLSKLDTQIMTRFSNEIACDFLQDDCSKTDFFYTIRANSAIVGGPSAGAPMTVLTVAALMDLSLDQSVVMTGTINSGGLLGSVGGVKEKIQAAQGYGLKTVLIPKWSLTDNQTNESMNYSNFNISVVEISTLDQALYYFTGQNFSKPDRDIEIPRFYSDVMKSIAQQLCSRTVEINNSLSPSLKVVNNSNYNSSVFYFNKSKTAMADSDYYSTASFCFSANLRLRTLSLQNKTDEQLLEIKKKIQEAIDSTNERLDEDFTLKTISDLEAFMVVKERLGEAQDFLNGINDSNISYSDIAYAHERYYSAASWSAFYRVGGKEFELDQENLKQGCLNKLSEAEERLNYVRLYLPEFMLEETQTELQHAYKDLDNQNYALCMFMASKAKAEANSLMTLMAIKTEDDLKLMLKEKFGSIKQIILREQDKGIFPILGYSYYEYAQNLVEDQPYSALTFTEYSLELSNLDIYFPKKTSFTFPTIQPVFISIFLSGLFIGLFIGIFMRKKRERKIRRRPAKRSK